MLFLGAGASHVFGIDQLQDFSSAVNNIIIELGYENLRNHIYQTLLDANENSEFFADENEIDMEVILSVLELMAHPVHTALSGGGPRIIYLNQLVKNAYTGISPIDFARFAEVCGGKGYSIKEPNDVHSIMHEAMSDKKPTIIEAYVDPFDPPMPPKVEVEFVRKMAESFAKGQPYAKRIGLTLFRNQVHERLRDFHHHQIDHHDHQRQE